LLFASDNEDYVTRKGFTVTANLFCARATFDRVGPFRTGVSEDTEWCWRARDLGFAIAYAPDTAVATPHGLTGLRWSRNGDGSAKKALNSPNHGGSVGPGSPGQFAMPLSIVAHAPRVIRAPKLSASERASAFVTLARIRLWRFGDAIRLAMK
jgi:hypothetical protein